jgi:hypothetical protein
MHRFQYLHAGKKRTVLNPVASVAEAGSKGEERLHQILKPRVQKDFFWLHRNAYLLPFWMVCAGDTAVHFMLWCGGRVLEFTGANTQISIFPGLVLLGKATVVGSL